MDARESSDQTNYLRAYPQSKALLLFDSAATSFFDFGLVLPLRDCASAKQIPPSKRDISFGLVLDLANC